MGSRCGFAPIPASSGLLWAAGDPDSLNRVSTLGKEFCQAFWQFSGIPLNEQYLDEQRSGCCPESDSTWQKAYWPCPGGLLVLSGWPPRLLAVLGYRAVRKQGMGVYFLEGLRGH